MSKFVRSIKNIASGYSSAQVLVRNATSNEPSGPTTYDMEEIAAATYSSQTDFMEIMDMLDRRLNDKGKNWRHVAKSLTVLDYLVRYGSDKCVLWSKDNVYIIKTLREFIHIDEGNNDQGAIIRVKAKELVSLLRDDERLRNERSVAANSRDGRSSRPNRSRRNTNSSRPRQNDQPYDEDLERALELSRITAEDDKRRQIQETDDPDLQAALKLSMEEEEMRKQQLSQNQNLLDLDETPQQQYYATGFYQPQQQYYAPQQSQQQFDMFGNPIQNPMATGLYQQQTYQQPQPDFQQYQQQQQQQQPFQQQQPQFTGFNFGQAQTQQPQAPLQPLKTGSNNPFALQTESQSSAHRPSQSLNELSEQQQQQPQQPQFFTQPTQQLKPQNTSSSRFNDSTHSELNNLLAQATGLDTFGNTGASRIPHQHTQTQNFINSSGTGYKQTSNEVKLPSTTTGNPFLTGNGNGYQNQQQQQQPQYRQASINPAYTGYGFGNAQTSSQAQRTDGPSLIDI